MEEKKEDKHERFRKIVSDWREFIEKRSEEATDFAKQRPGTALLVAFGLGLYLGRGLWKR
ncbi:MAG: hypothetical protein RDV41_02335 [Planctomycetota bacterium]|nr:hypothetical protein [Planctomycetota bacterium]